MDKISSFQAVLLGFFQGFTEFLPISSSAHLIFLSHLTGESVLPMHFNVSLHLGSSLAIIFYFHREWQKMMVQNILDLKARKNIFHSQNLLFLIFISSIPAGLVGVLGKHYIEEVFHKVETLILPLIIIGLLLWLVDLKCEQKKNLNHLSYMQALIIGLSQTLALIPGVSRSGSTIIAARFLKFKKEEAAKFSFLLGTPVMLGASLLHYKEIIASLSYPSFYLGVFCSCAVGVLTIKFFLHFITRFGFFVFALYRIIFALCIYVLS